MKIPHVVISLFLCLVLLLMTGLVRATDTNNAIADSAYAFFNPAEGKVKIPAVDVPNGTGGFTAYKAELALVDRANFIFQLDSMEVREGDVAGPHVIYNPVNGQVEFPGVRVPIAEGTANFRAALQLLPNTNPLRFALVNAEQLPYFPGIASLVALGTDRAQLNWLPATHNIAPEQLSYEIHLSRTPEFIPDAGTLHSVFSGRVQGQIDGLQADTDYYVLIVVKDVQGRKSLERSYRRVKTYATAPVLKSGVTLNSDEELGLAPPTSLTENQLSFAVANANAPEAGSILLGRTADGGGYLRRVESVSQTGSELVVHTSQAALADVLESATISNDMRLFDAERMNAANGATRTTRRGADGRRTTHLQWPDGSLSVKQVKHALQQDDVSLYPGTEPNRYHIHVDTSPAARRNARIAIPECSGSIEIGENCRTISAGSEGEITVSAKLDFEPDILIKAEWDHSLREGLQIKSGQLKAVGTLKLSVNTLLKFHNSASYVGNVPLFTTTYTSVYPIGPPPLAVYQEVSLSVDARLSAEIFSEIEAGANAETEIVVEFGVEYNPVTDRWEPVADTGFDKHLSTQLSFMGGATAEIRIIPNARAIFYKVISGNLSVEPHLDAAITVGESVEADFSEALSINPLQLTAFDLDLGAECYASANFQAFVKTYSILDKTKVCGPFTFNQFNLPILQLDVSAGLRTGDTTQFRAVVTDGVNNPFDAESAAWLVYPDHGGLSVDPENLLQATFTPVQAGNYTVAFSGYGLLGEFGRRYAVELVEVAESDDIYTAPALNDTGITWGGNYSSGYGDYSSGNNATCTGGTISQQDCSHGRDATHNNDADGHAGFSFTKIDGGNCVLDNVTDLMWEVKTNDGGLHDKDDTYQWYNTNPVGNGGLDGYANDDGNSCYGYQSDNPITYCNTQAYVARVNAAGWCGHHDWRMPNREELRSIVDYGRYHPAIDTDYFSNTRSDFYWSGSVNISDGAWSVNFNDGWDGQRHQRARHESRHVRLVRGGGRIHRMKQGF